MYKCQLIITPGVHPDAVLSGPEAEIPRCSNREGPQESISFFPDFIKVIESPLISFAPELSFVDLK